ncbi:MAG: corrinoid protein [Oscillospiraceae bacterium]|nr:corrinoid protein [Oscillospiraceae bacterium]
MSQILVEINENLQAGKAKAVADLVAKALEDGIAPKDILEEGMLSAMSVIGDKFMVNEIYVPEVLIAARAMNRGMEVLKPKLIAEGVQAKGVGVIGTVKGDLHDIGKNLVKMMMEGKGIEMHDLGVDVSPEQFLAAAKEHNASIICLSALLTTTMGEMKNVVDAVKAEGLEGKVKVMIGGAPVTQAYCDQIGADCYTADAASAANAAISFLSA